MSFEATEIRKAVRRLSAIDQKVIATLQDQVMAPLQNTRE